MKTIFRLGITVLLAYAGYVSTFDAFDWGRPYYLHQETSAAEIPITDDSGLPAIVTTNPVPVPSGEASWFYYLIGIWGVGVFTWLGKTVNNLLTNYIASKTKDELFNQAVQAITAGVSNTYDTYVKALKEAHADHKLTIEEEAEARQRAWDYAIEYGQTIGVNVAKIIGKHYAGALIEWVIGRLKSRSAPLV
jgi:hypothetical protein